MSCSAFQSLEPSHIQPDTDLQRIELLSFFLRFASFWCSLNWIALVWWKASNDLQRSLQLLEKVESSNSSVPHCVFRLEWLGIAGWGDFNSHRRLQGLFQLPSISNQEIVFTATLQITCLAIIWSNIATSIKYFEEFSKWSMHRRATKDPAQRQQRFFNVLLLAS